MRVEMNVFSSGSLGQIVRNWTVNPATYEHEDQFFHYDQVGSVMTVSDGGGHLAPPRSRPPNPAFLWRRPGGGWAAALAVLLIAAILLFYATLQSKLDSLYSHERAAFLAQAEQVQPGQTKSEVLFLIAMHDEVEFQEGMITFSLIPETRWKRHWGIPVFVNILFIHVYLDDEELVSRIQRGDG